VTYVSKGGERKQVFMVHRALLGSFERFTGILTEHYAGAFPTWLAPVQCMILPVSDEHDAFARSVLARLTEAGVRAEIDARDEKIGYRIRDAEMQKIPHMLVVGDKEVQEDAVAVRTHGAGDQGTKPVADFVQEVVDEIAARRYYIRKK
jgi:threonyl-tRNA synthetase